MKFKAVGFDYGGVIAGRPGFKKGAIALLGVSNEDFTKAYFGHNFELNRGELTWDQFWQIVLAELGRPDRVGDLIRLADEYYGHRINPDMLALADDLRSAGYATGVYSNYNAANADFMRELGLHDHFDTLEVSGQTGHVKPEPAAFYHLANALGVEVTELIFIDDSPTSLATAKHVGYYPILFTDADDLRGELERLGVL